MSTPPSGPRAALGGLALPLEGLRLLRRERRLWPSALVPFLVSVLVLVAATAALVILGSDLHAFATGWLPEPEVEAAWEWLWVGPARAALWVLGKLLFAALAAACLIAAFVVGSLLAAPFHDLLSRRVELLLTGRVEEIETSGVAAIAGEAWRAVREELRRMLFFLGAWVAIALLGLLLPGGPLLAPPALTLLTIFFLPLDYASYVLDRRRMSFREKRAWLRANAHTALGFGSAAFLVCAVPGLNALAMPVLVVSGTLLALRYPAEGFAAQAPRRPGGVGAPPTR